MKDNKRIIYSGFGDMRLHIIDYLFNHYGWQPVLVMSRDGVWEWSKANYPNAISCSMMQLRKGQLDYAGIGPMKPVDAKIIKALSEYELFAMNLMEDTTGWNFSFAERKRFYFELLNYWNTVLDRIRPNIFVSWTWPHTSADYVLYQLCKYYGIEVIYISPAPLFNHENNQYYHAEVSLEEPSKVLSEIYHSDEPLTLSEDVRNYLKQVRSKEGMVPPYMAYYWQNPDKNWNPGFWNNWIGETLRLAKMLLSGKFFRPFDLPWKCNKLPYENPNSRMNYYQYILFKERLRREDKKLKKVYASLVSQPDFDKKFIFYAAALQPEAGIWTVYQDQLLVLEMLSACLPEDWFIYYKEHPSMFIPGNKGSMSKDKHYYERVSQFKNLRLISTNVSSFQLIDAAQAVVTPGGTVGWESLVRGKPVINFGHVWYESCHGVMNIETTNDCKAALENVGRGFKPDQARVDRYAATVEKISIKNGMHGSFDQLKACADPKSEMERIAKFLFDAYERHYLKELKFAVSESGA